MLLCLFSICINSMAIQLSLKTSKKNKYKNCFTYSHLFIHVLLVYNCWTCFPLGNSSCCVWILISLIWKTERCRDRQMKRCSIYSFTPQMTPVFGTASGSRQGMQGLNLGFLCRPQGPSPTIHWEGACVTEKLELEVEPGLKLSYSEMGCGPPAEGLDNMPSPIPQFMS